MKKHVVSLLFFSFVFTMGCGSTQSIKTSDVANFNLKGSVKSIKSQSYYAKDSAGYVIKSSKGVGFGDFAYKDVAVKFNPEGSILNKATLGRNGQAESETRITYNQNAEIVTEASYNSGSLEKTREFSYATNGKLGIEKTTYPNTNSFYLRTYKYNNKGNVIEEAYLEITDKDTLLINKSKSTHKYNKQGIKILSLTESDEEQRQLTYNEKGQLITDEVIKGFENMILPKHTYAYNEQGLLVKESDYYANNEFAFANHFTYNKDGMLIEKGSSTELNGEYKKEKEMRYNKLNQIIEQKSFDENGNVTETIRLVYENDEKGNWIKRTVFTDNEPSNIVERIITYY
ncbi:hypothetical protein [Psychroflexus planctonicus]|uniref:YD repeat-containing protein n=1 Tax=Psychroflexus planctonicus TaxID=1526575 RepID=A0ABQ1SIP7_9FLAO|nr:hypothetical protein [Psychroflexus planctonicus]GGE38246.1 hypothetical protein GCM10010832_18130 [Psychroflexus planctonicus]